MTLKILRQCDLLIVARSGALSVHATVGLLCHAMRYTPASHQHCSQRLHLTLWTNRVAAEVKKVKQMFSGQVFGKIAKRNVHRSRSMCRILHPKTRRDSRARMFARRLIQKGNDVNARINGANSEEELAEGN